MYNIHNHYDNIFNLAKSIIAEPSLIYLYPFGSTQPENIEIKGNQTTHPEDDDVAYCPIVGSYPRSGPIIFSYDQEPLISGFNDPLCKHVVNNYAWLSKINYQLFLLSKRQRHHTSKYYHQPVILLNTELDSDEKEKLLLEFLFKDCYYFHHAFAAADWFRGYQYNPDLLPVKARTVKKKFITFNRITSNARVYRSLLVNELIKNDLTDQGHISYHTDCPVGGTFEDELRRNGDVFGIPSTLVEETITNISALSQPLRIDFKDETHVPNSSFEISAIKENMESFVHIVTETCYWGRKKHLTEKIFKPIVMRQPFILVGCAHNLEYLKSYGFKTFDRWWDESYDEIEDDIERMHAIGDLVADICKKSPEELTAILHDMEEVLEYNYRWFYSPEFLNYCWKELENNLRHALTSKP